MPSPAGVAKAPPQAMRRSEFARDPIPLPAAEAKAAKHVVEQNQSVWSIVKRELGPKASKTDLSARFAAYMKANTHISNLNNLVKGDELKIPPKAQPAKTGTQKTATETEKAQAASQTKALTAQEAEARKKGLAAVNTNLSNLADTAKKTPDKRADVAQVASEQFAEAKRLGGEDAAKGSPAGQALVKVIDEVAQTTKKIDDLAGQVSLASSMEIGFSDAQRQDFRKQAAPLLADAKAIGLKTQATRTLENLGAPESKHRTARETQTKATEKGIEAHKKEQIAAKTGSPPIKAAKNQQAVKAEDGSTEFMAP